MANQGEGIFWGDAASDPKRGYRFFLYVGGIPVWVVKTVTKPSVTINTIQHTYLNHTFNFPGRVEWDGEITATLADPLAPDLAKTLIDTVRASGYQYPDQPDSFVTTSKAKALAALGGGVVIAQIDPEGRAVEEWTLKNAWISSVSFGDTLDYTSDEATELSVTIKYDWAEMTVFGEPVAGMGGN
tara:strand:- start:9857 stop:10411 length:555 start_codon:yes stop_codon:yes gene_type:complete